MIGLRQKPESRRDRARQASTWGTEALVLIDGDADLVVDALRKAAREAGVELLDPQAADATDPQPKASVAVIAVHSTNRSSLNAGMLGLDARRDLIADDAVRIVVGVSDRVDLAPKTAAKLLGPEILHQIAAATSTDAERSTWRSLKLRIGASMLSAAGLHVFQVGRMRRRSR